MRTTPDFDSLYRRDRDPWRVGTSFYELRKQDLLLAALGRARYAAVWDTACGTGHLVAQLAGRAEWVTGSDASRPAIEIAEQTCAGLGNVTLVTSALPGRDGAEGELDGPFELIVIAEFLYYLPAEDRRAVLDLLDLVSAEDAEVVSVHWRHHPHDAWLSGQEMQTELTAGLRQRGWTTVVHLDDPDFVLDTFRGRRHRVDPRKR